LWQLYILPYSRQKIGNSLGWRVEEEGTCYGFRATYLEAKEGSMMELVRRNEWQRDQPIPGTEIEISTCISCPDSGGFSLSNDCELFITKPICQWFKDEINLIHFPLIPHWCPRLDLQPNISTGVVNPENFYRKRQAWLNLSREAKMVLNILFTLPEEFLTRNKTVIKSIISHAVKENRGNWHTKVSGRVYQELKDFTRELLY